MQRAIIDSDSKYRTTRPIASWAVLDKPQPFGQPSKRLRVEVTYPDGTVRMLPAAFRDRPELDKYVARWHPDFSGKEVSGEY